MSYALNRAPAYLGRNVEQLFDEFLGNGAGWVPAMDVAETEDALTVRAEVPGVEPKDITITFEKNTLTLSGEKKAEEAEKARLHRAERRSGRFVRQVEFQTMVDGEKIEATFKNGVVTVRLPKHEKAKARTIEVKQAD